MITEDWNAITGLVALADCTKVWSDATGDGLGGTTDTNSWIESTEKSSATGSVSIGVSSPSAGTQYCTIAFELLPA